MTDLAKTHVHVAGTGRIGSEIIFALHRAGVGHISCNDPQVCEEEQFQHWTFVRPSDLGRPKVYVLERLLDGSRSLIFEPVVAKNESPQVLRYLEHADLDISCANNFEARMHLEQTAIRMNKLSLQASAQDGRESLGGLISVRVPDTDRCCFGCLFPTRPSIRRGELLLPTVTATIANVAAHIATSLLTGDPIAFARQHNVFAVDLQKYAIERLSIKPRPTCPVCGRRK